MSQHFLRTPRSHMRARSWTDRQMDCLHVWNRFTSSSVPPSLRDSCERSRDAERNQQFRSAGVALFLHPHNIIAAGSLRPNIIIVGRNRVSTYTAASASSIMQQGDIKVFIALTADYLGRSGPRNKRPPRGLRTVCLCLIDGTHGGTAVDDNPIIWARA